MTARCEEGSHPFLPCRMQEKLAQNKARYQKLLAESQNSHPDPILKSLQLAIAKLEKQLQAK